MALAKRVREIVAENDRLRIHRDKLYDVVQVIWLKFQEDMTPAQAIKVEELLDEGKW
jgi:hypothetical protein